MDKLHTCHACGAEVAKSAKSCPHCGAKQKRRPILGAILIVIGVIIILAAIGGGGGSSPEKVGEVEKKQDTPQKQTEFYVGDVVAVNDIEVSFISCEESYGSGFLTPDAGNVYLVCEFEVNNKSNKDINVSSILCFEAYVDDYATNMSIYAGSETDKGSLDGTVAAGKRLSGVIGYEVPEDWETLEVRFTPDFWSNRDITFIATK